MSQKMKASKRLLSLLLCLVMVLGMLPTVAFAEADSRIPLEEVTGSAVAGKDYKDLAVYGNPIWDTAKSLLIKFTFTNEGLSCPDSMYDWQKKNSDGTWETVTTGIFTPGTYRLRAQLRYKSSSKRLVTDTVVKIDGAIWTHNSPLGSDNDDYSFFTIFSPEINVTKPNDDLVFTESRRLDIPQSYVGRPITSYSLLDYVIGGEKPYTFTKMDQTAYTGWIDVSADGIVSGTPTKACSETYFTVKVTDAKGEYKTIDIQFYKVTQNPEARSAISIVEATSDIKEELVYNRYAFGPTLTVTSGEPAVFESFPRFEKWNDATLSWESCSVFRSWQVTKGKYRVSTQVRIERYNANKYKFADDLTLKVDGVPWTVEKVNNFSSYCAAFVLSPEFTVTEPVPLTGTVTLSGAYYASPVNPNTTGLPSSGLSYQWQRSSDGTNDWTDISGATDRAYYPNEADVGKYIRVVITADGYEGSVISNAVKVKQALINFEKPVAPEVRYYTTGGVVVENAKAGQEYIVKYTSDTPADWSGAVKATEDGNLALGDTYGSNMTVYVHTRVAATTYKPAGMYTEYGSVYIGSPSTMVDIALNYTKLDIKVGDIVKLTVKPVPDDSNYTNAFWFLNGTEVKLYIDEACTTEYVRDTHRLRTYVYLKGIAQTNSITVGAEKTISSMPTTRQITVAVTDEADNYLLDGLVLPEVTLTPGESTTVDITTMPAPVLVGTLSFEKTEGTSELTLTAGADNKTLTINVPENATAGSYYYSIKVNGATTKTPSGIRINVVSGKEIPVDSVSVLPSAVIIAPGKSVDLTAIVSPSNATGDKTVIWSVDSGSDKISVDNTGKVTVSADAPEDEEAVIKATAGGKSGTSTVKVGVPTYCITVLGGTAYNGETETTEAKEGTLIDIVADAPASGEEFDKWKVVSGDVTLVDATQSVTLFAMPAKDVVIQATYKNSSAPVTTYNLTTQVNGGHGTISAGKTGLTAGSTETVIFAPDTGYEIDTVTVNGVETGVLSNVLNVTMDADKTVIVTYKVISTVPTAPSITTTTLPDGKVGEAYNQTLAATGTNPITWNIETGALPNGLTLAGDTIEGTPSKAGDFKFTVKATNAGGSDTKELTIKIADAEAAKYHNVTLTGAGTGATGAGSHAAGTTVNIYAGTKSGYTFNGWTSDDVTVLSASSKNASFVMPDKDVIVKANWTYNGSSGGGYTYYTIKSTAGVNGSISPTGNVSVREGRDQTFTITPNKGYAVAKVLIDSKNVGAVKSYTFENVRKNHTIEVVFMKAGGNPQTGVFVDVPEGSYYEEAVNWAVENGITTGTDATHFTPDGICTRAQAVTFLWRAVGSPAAKSSAMPFADVKSGSYYYDAVLWAVENGITKGTSETMFSPNATCSRAQIVTFLWRSQKSPAAGTANPFTDVKASAYYADAVLWAVKEDVTKGTTATTFSPDDNCTRAQIVTFIWRALAE